ncbi:MAG: hypothetical protein ACXW1W_11235 [Methylococcaceae bacterium]
MTNASRSNRAVPRSGLLRWEIGIALLIKIILLTGLWCLIFRWSDKPTIKPDIAQRFSLSADRIDFSSLSLKESRHVR